MRELLNKYGTQAGAALMVVMVVMTLGIPVPSIQGGDLGVERQQAVGEADGLAVTSAVAIGFVVGAGGAAIADAAYHHYVEERDASAMSDEELKVAIAQDAYSAQQTQENYITDSQNALTLSENSAKREAYQTYVNERAAGASHSEAVTAAKNRVDDFYAKQQVQLMNKYETQVVEGGGYCSMARQWDDLGTPSNVIYGEYTESDSSRDEREITCDASGYNASDFYITNAGDKELTPAIENGSRAVEVPLVNGSETTVRTFGYTNNIYQPVYSGTYSEIEVYDPDADSYVEITLAAPHGDVGPTYNSVFADIESQHSTVQSTLGNASSGYLTDVNNYQQNNDANWTELAIEEPDVDLNNTSVTKKEYYTRVLGQNLDSPETGTVMTIETPDGDGNTTTLNGTVYTSYAPPTDPDNDSEGEWVTGHTYNASQGVTYVLDTDGDLHVVEGDMTITSITTPSGESVNTTDHEDVTLDTSDTSDLKNQIDRLNNRIDEIEEENSDDGGFTIPGFGGSSGMGLLLLAGVALILMKGRGGGGSGGGTTNIIAGGDE